MKLLRSQKDQSIAIVGIGSLFPKSSSLKEYWRLLTRGEDAITDVPATHWSAVDYYRQDPSGGDFVYCKRGGYLSPVSFDPTEFNIPPSILEATDSSQLLGLVVTRMALEDAGYGQGGRPWDRDATGVVIGVTGTQELVIPLSSRLGFPIWKKALEDAGVSRDQAEQVVERIADAYVSWQENSFPGLLGNVVAGRIANRFDLGGTNCAVDAACASSLAAVNLAVLELMSGRSDMMIAGGIDTLNDIFMHMCFSKTSVLSFSGDARPFSKDADGTVLGEGLGVFLLKRLEDAERDKDKIYAVIRSVGTSSDGRSAGIYAPVAEGQLKALRRAYEYADISPATVEMAEAHGTGTRVGDAVEFEALSRLYREAGAGQGQCALGSVKSIIGHTKAAAGAASLAKTALALYHKAILPTLKIGEPDPKLNMDQSPFYISTLLRPWLSNRKHPRRAAMSSFGFGGSNYHMVLEEYAAEKTVTAWDNTVEIAAFSGSTKAEVLRKMSEFRDAAVAAASGAGVFSEIVGRHAAESRNAFRHTDKHRALVVIDLSRDKAAETLQAALDTVEKAEHAFTSTENVFYGTSDHPDGPVGKTAFIFPGQGSQYTYMARDLAVIFPEAHRVFETANRQFENFHDAAEKRLSDYIFPAGLTEDVKKQAEEALRSTDIAQPAIGAASLAMARILARFGLAADMTCGHSFGELTALCQAGWMDEETFLALAAARGKYMAAAGREPGAMMAVKEDLARIEALVAENSLDLVLANRNSYDQGVLSGREAEIERALAICKQNKIRATRLPVSAAFHTPLVQDAAKPFRDYLRKKEIAATAIPVYSNTTAALYPTDDNEIRQVLGRQILNPVSFVDEIERMYADGARIFMEIGPKSVLTGLVRSILKGKEFHALALDASGGRKSGLEDLARTLCFFAAVGHAVNLEKWEDPPVPVVREQKMSVPILGANYRREKPPRPKKAVAAVPPPVRQEPPAERKDAPPVHAPERAPVTPAPVSAASDSGVLRDALKVVSESLKSMQSLQQQTALAHQKFLETQTEAGRALGVVMEKTRHLSAFVMDGSAIPVETTPRPVRPPSVMPVVEPVRPAPLPEPVTTAAETPPPAGPAAPAVDAAMIQRAMLDIVSRVTGYPVEMLGLEMDIENDLGIDSIKRVEILSVFEEEHPDVPSAAPEDLAEMRTLGEICDHLLSLAGAVVTAGAHTAVITEKAAAGISAAEIQSAMLDIVSRVTGYPVEMLGLEMDIENDLGIDSIKRVEILSVFEEEHPDIPSAAPEDLAEMRTLGEICDHLLSLAGAHTAVTTGNTAAAGVSAALIQSAMLDIVSRVTGYPPEMLDLQMDIENDLGIDSIKRVEILSVFEEEHPDIPSAAPEDLAEMRTLGQICDHLLSLAGASIKPATTSGQETASIEPTPAITEPATVRVPRRRIELRDMPLTDRRPVTIADGLMIFVTGNDPDLGQAICDRMISSGVRSCFLNTIDSGQDFSKAGGLVIVSRIEVGVDTLWSAADEAYVKDVFALAAKAGPALVKNSEGGKDTVFAAITRLDGAMGFGDKADFNPLQGALAGLVKTAAIEWPTVACRAVDADPGWTDTDAVAAAVTAEILNQTGPVEVGLTRGSRRVIALVEAACPEGDIRLEAGDVIVVSGGARGVTAQCVKALAGRAPAAIALLGRSPLPAAEPEWLGGVNGEAEIKKKIMENEFSGRKISPMELEASYKKYIANREVSDTIAYVRGLGRKVVYYPVDIRDPEAVKKTIDVIRRDQGTIRCLIHGAGVLEDRFIVEKTRPQFDRVFDTKVAGARALLSAVDPADLRYVVFFSSVSARMGNRGQVDYAMANEVLNKTARKLSFRLPECRVIAINWGPWDGGMVTPSLKREFEKNGLALIPLEAGAQCLLAEMGGRDRDENEIVIGAGFSDLIPGTASPADAGHANKEPDVSVNNSDLSVAFEREVSLSTFPVLKAHMLGGKAVVPFALAAEWVGSGALHANPGLLLTGIDDMRVLSGIVLDGASENVAVMTGKPKKNGSVFEVEVQVSAGKDAAGKRLKYAARAVLCADYETPPAFREPASLASGGYARPVREVYEKILFHGRELAGIREIPACTPDGIKALVACAPPPRQWISQPLRNTWLADPLVLDTAFQLGIVWCYENAGMVCLPVSFKTFRQYRPSFPADGVITVLEVNQRSGHRIGGDFTFLDADGIVVARMTGYEAVMDKSLEKAFKF
ncbi:MAG: SDR family NAD(P)-dependent oxidoreductase [Thermodesulfobacteriota bacterium]